MIEIILDHKPTNADRIKSLNDEELAEFVKYRFCPSISKEFILAWLQKPAE